MTNQWGERLTQPVSAASLPLPTGAATAANQTSWQGATGSSVPANAAFVAAVSGGNLTLVVVVAVIALLALAVAGWLVRDVLAASQGTEKMQEIAHAVQEGAAAYLRRQFRTLGVFVVIIFFVLLVLPAFRRQGIGAALCATVERFAQRLSVQTLYLYTLDQQPLYGALGWRPFDRALWRGYVGDIMMKNL